METQKKHTAKSNRITVPFYIPPTRHYGQTPSEIIREARESVMSPTPGIKPVLTSRPFTPKEKERTLFGNVKKRLSRPPSAFSLSYLRKPESLPRIKLPAIGTISRKKVERSPNFRTVHSLDNYCKLVAVVEEYEAEVLEESQQSDLKGLPFFRDTHSSPQERKSTHSDSLKKIISPRVPEKRSIYTISQECMGKPRLYSSDDTYFDYFKISDQHTKDTTSPRSTPVSQNKSTYHLAHINLPAEEVYLASGTLSNSSTEAILTDRSTCKELHVVGDILVEGWRSTEQRPSITLTKSEARPDEQMAKPGQNLITKETTVTEEKVSLKQSPRKKDIADLVSVVDLSRKSQSLVEKYTETGIVSEYLSLLNNKVPNKEGHGNHKTKEILELYETADYYNVLDNTGTSNIYNLQEKDPDMQKKTEDPFDDEMGTSKNLDYLQTVKENIKNFDLKMKKLNESIETFEEKLNGRNIYSSNCVTAKEFKKTNQDEYNMNNDRRYHLTDYILERNERMHKQYLNDVSDLVREKKESQGPGWDGFWKNSYYQQKGEIPVDTKHALKHLDDFLAKLINLNETGAGNDEIATVTTDMYMFLKKEDIIHKHINNETKIKTLRILYNFADSEHPETLLNLARIIFYLKLENSLSAACKMVFKVARSDSNDNLFLETEEILGLFLDGIGLVSPLDAAECCIYGYGALKFLTMNHRILSRLISLGVLDLLVLHLKIINSAKLDGHAVNEQTQYALFQLTGALRNIAAGDGVLPLFITTNSIPVLCKILSHFHQCEDLVTNISRTLSLLSADEDAIDILMSVENILGIIINLMEQYKLNDNILIRLSYCLGNIVAYNDIARIQLSRSEVSVKVLLKILKLYMEKDLELSVKEKTKSDNDDGLGVCAVDDIIVKVIRIIANMCMNPVVGSNLSPNESNDKNSLILSKMLTTLLQRKDPGIILLACLGCLNNISYYCGNHPSLIDITEGIIRILGLHDEECQAEAARVLGNLTRHEEIRDLICTTGGIDQLTKLLDNKDKDVYRSACGALVNLMLDHETRTKFVESHGIDKLVHGLEKFSGDWSFAALICRAIWNSCADDMETVSLHNNIDKLLHLLAHSLDEENWNDGDLAWEEFAFLATDLLEKINAYLDLQ